MSNFKIEDGEVKINLIDLVGDLSDEEVGMLADEISWSRILEHFDRHITGKSDYWAIGEKRTGHNIREHIEKVQGTKDERVKDLEAYIRSLERDKENYHKYYKWYFRSYHHDYGRHKELEKEIGTPETPNLAEEKKG